MARVIPSYTMCSLSVTIKKDFQLELSVPSDENVERFKREFNIKSLSVDEDQDLNCSGGTWNQVPGVVIKQIALWLSRGRLIVRCLRGTTDDCYAVLYGALATLYGVPHSTIEAGLDYVQYETTTKVQFSNPIYGLFSKSVNEQVARWSDLSTGALLRPVRDGDWRNDDARLMDIDVERYKKVYEGQPSAIVIPSAVQFSIWLPSNFARMTTYHVRIQSESVEDFHDDLYYVRSDFPYAEHVRLLGVLDGNDPTRG